MLMKSSISFSKNTLFSQSVSSASISSVWRRMEICCPRPSAGLLQSSSVSASSAMAAAAPQQYSRLRFHFLGIPENASGIRRSCAGPRRFFPGFLARLFANLRTASGSPENRDLGAALLGGPASSAESCHAVLRDVEAVPLPAIPRARSWRRSDTWLPPAEKSLHCIVLSYRHDGGVAQKGERKKKSYAAVAAAGMNS